jgi:hypothetical protein
MCSEKKIWKRLIGLRGAVYLYGFVIGLKIGKNLSEKALLCDP